MKRSRRRTALLAGAGVALSAAAAQASVSINESIGANVVENSGTFTPITFTISGLSGADATLGNTGVAGLILLSGDFTATNGGMIAVPGSGNSSDNGYWQNYINTPGVGTLTGGFTYAASGVNMSQPAVGTPGFTFIRSGTGSQTGTAPTAIYGNSTLFGGSTLNDTWYCPTGTQVGNGSVLATIFVTPGSDAQFTGVYGSYGNVGNVLPGNGTSGSLYSFGGSGAGTYTIGTGSSSTVFWNGTVNGKWDTTTANWQYGALYATATAVVFNGTAAGPNYNVDLFGTTVTPSSVTVAGAQDYQIGNGTIGGTGTTLTMAGAGNLTLNGNNTYTGTTTVQSGQLIVAATGSLPSGSTLVNNAATQFQGTQTLGMLVDSTGIGTNGTTTVANTGSLTVSTHLAQAGLVNNGTTTVNGLGTVGQVSGTGNITVGGSGSLTTGAFAQNVLTNNGTTQIKGTGTVGLLAGTGNLTVGNATSNNTVTLTGTYATNNVGGLTVATGSALNIGSNIVNINYTGGSPITSIQGYIATGHAGGNFNGPGIDSSYVAGKGGQYGIGFADAADAGNPAGLPSNTIKVMPALMGDATLAGTVSGVDLAIVVQNYGATTPNWDQGNFYYDPNNAGTFTVNGADLAAVVQNYGATGLPAYTVITTDNQALLSDSGALAMLSANGITVVPEPGMLSLLGLGAVGFLARRRRSK